MTGAFETRSETDLEIRTRTKTVAEANRRFDIFIPQLSSLMSWNKSSEAQLYLPKLSLINQLNCLLTLLVGLGVAVPIFYQLLLTQPPKEFRFQRRCVLCLTVIYLLYFLVNYLCQHQLKLVTNSLLLIRMNGPIAKWAHNVQVLGLGFVFTFQVVACTSLLPQNLFRYLIVTRKSSLKFDRWLVFGLIHGLTILFIFAAATAVFRLRGEHSSRLNSLIQLALNNHLVDLGLSWLTCYLVATFILSSFLGYWILKRLFSECITFKTRRLCLRARLTILVQSTAYLLLAFLPILSLSISLMFRFDPTEPVVFLASATISWVPILDLLTMVFLIRPFRTALLCRFPTKIAPNDLAVVSE